jgi:hypothetical protein
MGEGMTGGAKVTRSGTARTAKDTTKRHKRPCRSAPAVPANVTLNFRRREIRKREIWRANVDFDAVTVDVAGRTIDVELYEAELRATDASGDPVETNLQAKAATADGQDFTVQAGTAPVNGIGRELNATADIIKKTLTGLTGGIDAQVHFFARKDLAGSAPVLRFYIYNVTDSVEVVTVSKAPDSIRPRVTATRGFTPVGGKTYEARATFVSGTGIGIVDHIQWHDKGNAATWRERVAGDDNPRMAVFTHLAKPRAWYYQARVRVLNRVHGGRCWSAWSAWTTATNAVTGDTTGPPVPTGVTLTFDKVEGSRRRPWRARSLWNEIPWWFPADDDPVEGADAYRIQLQVSNDGGATIANTRTVVRPARDEDTDTTARFTWFNIRRVRSYRTRVRARDEDGRWGAWSAWTTWAQPATSFTVTVQNLVVTNPTPSTYRAIWDEPSDPSDVDRYKVVWRRKNADTSLTIMQTYYTTGTRASYHVPLADRDRPHRCKVTPVLEELHTQVDDGAGAYQAEAIATDTETADTNNTAQLPPETWSSGTQPAATTVTVAGTVRTAASGTRWEMGTAAGADQLTGYVATFDSPGIISIEDPTGLVLSAPFDTGQNAPIISLTPGTGLASQMYLANGLGTLLLDATDIRLESSFQGRGYCSVAAYNDNATARNFGHGVMYGGVNILTNVPSSITFTLVGTDLNMSSPAAGDITTRGFRFQILIDPNANGRASRTFVTVGN